MKTSFAVPVTERYLEDYLSGSTYEFSEISWSAKEIVDFAKRFDPQGIHTDREAAARGPFGGLIASGWHTAAVMMRETIESILRFVRGGAFQVLS